LPNPNSRRRNAPTISTTSLPADGRKGRAPKPPESAQLQKAGAAWWKWAWSTPQSAAWDSGALYAIARRAQLEDDLAALDLVDDFDLAELLGLEDNDMLRSLERVIGRLKGSSGGRVALMREMRELDKRLGLDPKAMAELRWKIAEDEVPKQAERAAAPTERRLRAV
jgi:hypothetical protein